MKIKTGWDEVLRIVTIAANLVQSGAPNSQVWGILIDLQKSMTDDRDMAARHFNCPACHQSLYWPDA